MKLQLLLNQEPLSNKILDASLILVTYLPAQASYELLILHASRRVGQDALFVFLTFSNVDHSKLMCLSAKKTRTPW